MLKYYFVGMLTCISVLFYASEFLFGVRYFSFDTDISRLPKAIPYRHSDHTLIIISMLVLLVCETECSFAVILSFYDFSSIITPVLLSCLKLGFSLQKQMPHSNKVLAILIFFNLTVQPPIVFCDSMLIKPLWTVLNSSYYDFPTWVSLLVLLLSNDIEINPGDRFREGFLSFCNWNINSLSKDGFQRISLLEAHNTIYNYDIISLCETSLDDTIVLPEKLLNGYKFISKNSPSGKKQGGVGIFYRESLPLKTREDLSFNECIVVELRFPRKKIFFTVLYRNPAHKADSPEFDMFLTNFETLCQNIKSENPHAMLFSGDFNGHCQQWWPEGDSNKEGIIIDNLTCNLGLTQLISEPTNFQENSRPSCIDLIFCDQPNLIIESGVLPSLDPFCKHQITFCRLNYQIPPAPAFHRKVWLYDRAQVELLQRSIAEFPWHDKLNSNLDPNWQVTTFNSILLNILSNYIPNKVVKIDPKDPPWITHDLKKMIKRQQRMYKNFKRHGYRDEDRARVQIFRDECNLCIQTAKENYLAGLGEKLADPRTSQKFYWKILNKLLNKHKAPKIPPLLINNQFVVNCKEKAIAFNNFFANQCKPLINNSVLPAFTYLTGARLNSIQLTDDDIACILKTLNPGKSNGPDEISTKMLIICGDTLVVPLRIIFDNILSTGIFPDIWKTANVVPIHKKEDKQLIKNYRPISLLPVIAKLFEKVLFKHLYNFFEFNHLITKKQSGFRPGDSTTNQLIDFVNEIHKSFDDKKSLEVRAVFLDISKAFDKVWHPGLLFKLKQNGIDGRLLTLLNSYLTDRKQRVVLNGTCSDWESIESGVPQGSVLGPLLFLIYINDLEQNINSGIKFFADDTMLYSIVHDEHTTAIDLNQDLQTITNWANQWKMAFNPDPNKQAVELIFSQKKNKPLHPLLFFNGIKVTSVESHKHLGVILDSKLNFNYHFNEKISKARKGIGIIKYLSSFTPNKTLDQIYKMYVRPHLDYCDVIYHVPPLRNPFESSLNLTVHMEHIERVQYQAALAITGCWQGSNRNKLYEELGWESLSDRRWFRRLVYFYKIFCNNSPPYLYEHIPQIRIPIYGQRRPKILHEIKCRTAKYMNSFFPNCVKSWNNMSDEIRYSDSLMIFKTKLISLIRPPKKSIYDIHKPSDIKNIFRLRLGLSQLKSHKKGTIFLIRQMIHAFVTKHLKTPFIIY